MSADWFKRAILPGNAPENIPAHAYTRQPANIANTARTALLAAAMDRVEAAYPVGLMQWVENGKRTDRDDREEDWRTIRAAEQAVDASAGTGTDVEFRYAVRQLERSWMQAIVAFGRGVRVGKAPNHHPEWNWPAIDAAMEAAGWTKVNRDSMNGDSVGTNARETNREGENGNGR